MLRGLVVLRVIIVSTILLSAFLIQITFSLTLPLNPIYYLAAFAYSNAIAALALLRRIPGETHAGFQILGDLVVVTGLVYISGGPDSGFTFLYLSSVTAGAVLLGRRGGVVTAALASIFYASLVQLMHSGVLPSLVSEEIPTRAFTPGGLIGNVALNVFAFFATAFIVSTAAEKLHEARADAERRREEVSRLQALHSSVLSSMSSGVVTTDRHGDVTYLNPPGLELLKKSAREVLGRPLVTLGLVSSDDWRLIQASGGETIRLEGLRRLGKEEAYVGVSATPLRDGEGRTVGRILIFQDLTDLKKLEGAVRLKEKMAAVGELAASIAHEIRNPLASISGSVQVLRSTSIPDSSEGRLMDIVVKESHRLSSILEDFLKYVRPRERAVEPVDASATLRDAVTLLQHSDELGPSHRVEANVEPESVVVSADPGQLRQIFWNLARNAIAAMPAGGTLKISSRLSGESWTFSVADEGRGMTADERDRLFTPFAHSFPGGTGLGLAIVYRIVEEHGGSITVDTAPGRGTTFTIALPRAAGAPAGAHALAASGLA